MSDDFGDSRYQAYQWNPVLLYNQPATIDGVIEEFYDEDWFQITLEKGYKYEFELIGKTFNPDDLGLTLYDSVGSSIGTYVTSFCNFKIF